MKRNIYILIIILSGIFGAVMRGMSITGGLDAQSGLPVSGDMPSLILKILCVAVLIISIVMCRAIWKKGENERYEDYMGSIGKAAGTINKILGGAAAVIGAYGLITVPKMIAEQTDEYRTVNSVTSAAIAAQWILLIITGIMLALFAANQNGKEATKRQGIRVTVPMFWACLNLIMTYHENSANPVMQDYVYELLLSAVIMAAFYAIAGMFFAEPKIRIAAIFEGLAVFLMLTCTGGAIIAGLINPAMVGLVFMAPQLDICRLAAYAVLSLYLLVELAQTKIPKNTK